MSQADLFAPPPCPSCGIPIDPHWLPNYPGQPWVSAHGPACGPLLYAKSREGLATGQGVPLKDWETWPPEVRECEICHQNFKAPYWSDNYKCDACLIRGKNAA